MSTRMTVYNIYLYIIIKQINGVTPQEELNNNNNNDNRPRYISVPNPGKRIIHKDTRQRVCAQLHFTTCQEIRYKIRQKNAGISTYQN